MDTNVTNHFTFSEIKAKDIDTKCMVLSKQVATTVQIKEFQQLQDKIANLKNMVESEMDLIQTHVRNAKDLQGELLKKFELAMKAQEQEPPTTKPEN